MSEFIKISDSKILNFDLIKEIKLIDSYKTIVFMFTDNTMLSVHSYEQEKLFNNLIKLFYNNIFPEIKDLLNNKKVDFINKKTKSTIKFDINNEELKNKSDIGDEHEKR